MYKIAVIEDDTLLGQALVEMLTSHGYQAFAAESVTKARRLLERQPVDLLLIDRGLADGDGVELCRQRSGQEKLPAIFLTARDEEEDIVEAFDTGADDYLVKPVALAVLLKHIEAVLPAHRSGGLQGRRRSDARAACAAEHSGRHGRRRSDYGGKPQEADPRHPRGGRADQRQLHNRRIQDCPRTGRDL